MENIHNCHSFTIQSEERGKDDTTKEQSMRAAGSSPCVGADTFNVRSNLADPEQGIYHGAYRVGMWICITDRDVWHRNDFPFNDGMDFVFFYL